MKLYNVPKNTWVRSIEPNCKDEFKLDHIDGMYSYCFDMQGNVCHYSASMKVEILNRNPDGSSWDGMS